MASGMRCCRPPGSRRGPALPPWARRSSDRRPALPAFRINNCVGEDNHWLFLQLCFYTQVLSLFTLVLDFCQYYYFQPLSGVDPEQFTSGHELALLRISTFMGLLMLGGMSSLFYTQITGILAVRLFRSSLLNKTTSPMSCPAVPSLLCHDRRIVPRPHGVMTGLVPLKPDGVFFLVFFLSPTTQQSGFSSSLALG
uniref:Palmitoyltransferase n=1 Tax=Paramormyrops kingsleyae TaxID=1676925 RepID=A0A3B3QQ61_9TELE